MANIRYRLLIIAALVVASIFALYPRTVTVRERDRQTGQFVEHTVRRVPLKRGLDLQGGIHLALEVDESKGAVANKSDAIDRALKVVRNRIDQFGVSEPVVQKAGTDRIIVEVPGETDPARAEQLVVGTAFLQFQITDKTNALDKALPRLDQIIRSRGAVAGTSAASGAKKDSAKTGGLAISGLLQQTSDSGKAKTDTSKARADSGLLAGAGGPLSKLVNPSPNGTPGEYLVARADIKQVEDYLALPEVKAALPPGKSIVWGIDETGANATPYRAFYVVDTRAIIDGLSIIDAKPANTPLEGNVVEFTLNNVGGRRFKQETSKHVGDFMAIVLDGRVMGRPPRIESPIATRGQITMRGQPLQAAQDLALVLRAGALPVPLKTVDTRYIGASLGEDSIHDGIKAGVLGVLLVIVVMVGYYRFSGVIAVSALTLYVLFTLATLAGFNATMTLPGLAGLVLSVGIAVDANVLIFERIREELAHGKSTRVAIDEGFRHALPAIVDSNVSTILTAIVLYYLGTGPVKGFAVTLIAGIASSMVSAIFVVRTFYLLWLNRTRGAQPLSI